MTGWQIAATGNFARGITTELGKRDSGGIFRIATTGTYACSANLVLKGVEPTTYYRLFIRKGEREGDIRDFRGSHHQIIGEAVNERAFNVGGVFQLQAGDDIRLYVYTLRDASFLVTSESGFHCAYLGDSHNVEAFNANGADTGGSNRLTPVPTKLRNFRTTSSWSAFSTTRNFEGSPNVYTATKPGIHLFYASLRFDGMGHASSSPYFRVKMSKNNYNDYHGVPVWIEARPSRNYESAHLTGTALLQTGDKIDMETTTRVDNSWRLYGVGVARGTPGRRG